MPTLGNKAIDGAVNVCSCMCACAHACMLHHPPSNRVVGQTGILGVTSHVCFRRSWQHSLGSAQGSVHQDGWAGQARLLACIHTHVHARLCGRSTSAACAHAECRCLCTEVKCHLHRAAAAAATMQGCDAFVRATMHRPDSFVVLFELSGDILFITAHAAS